jgi:hypothetical protein
MNCGSQQETWTWEKPSIQGIPTCKPQDILWKIQENAVRYFCCGARADRQDKAKLWEPGFSIKNPHHLKMSTCKGMDVVGSRHPSISRIIWRIMRESSSVA